MNKKMLKIEKTENCVTFNVIQVDFHNGGNPIRAQRSHNFYITKNSLNKVINEPDDPDAYFISKDIYSFCEVSRRDNILSLNFTWLNGSHDSLSGKQELLNIPYDKFFDFFIDDTQKSIRVLHDELKKVPRIQFHSAKRLKEVLANPIVKRKFLKALDKFTGKQVDEIHFYDDYTPFSFEWASFVNGKRDIVGGLIFHQNGETDLKKCEYGVHT
jgi:hypothetical protein